MQASNENIAVQYQCTLDTTTAAAYCFEVHIILPSVYSSGGIAACGSENSPICMVILWQHHFITVPVVLHYNDGF